MYCQKCGAQQPDNNQVCSNCGNQMQVNVPRQPQQPPQSPYPPPPPKKKTSGCLIAVLVCAGIFVFFIILVVVLGSSSDNQNSSSSESHSQSSQPAESDVESESQLEEPAEEMGLEGEGPINDYYIKINGYEIAQDYSGRDCIVISYEWTNNSDEAKSFMLAFDDTVYQDGVECSGSLFVPDGVEANVSSKDIKPGTTYELKQSYVLNNTSSPVEVEIKPFASFSKNPSKVEKTFDIQ